MRPPRQLTYAQRMEIPTSITIPPAVEEVFGHAEPLCHPHCCGIAAYGLSAAYLVPWVAKMPSEKFAEVCAEFEALLRRVHGVKGCVRLEPDYGKWDAREAEAFFTALLQALDRALDLVRVLERLEKHVPKNITELRTGWRFGERYPR
jgi:hypothetical protein